MFHRRVLNSFQIIRQMRTSLLHRKHASVGGTASSFTHQTRTSQRVPLMACRNILLRRFLLWEWNLRLSHRHLMMYELLQCDSSVHQFSPHHTVIRYTGSKTDFNIKWPLKIIFYGKASENRIIILTYLCRFWRYSDRKHWKSLFMPTTFSQESMSPCKYPHKPPYSCKPFVCLFVCKLIHIGSRTHNVITSSSIDRLKKFFHWHTQQWICSTVIVEDSATPHHTNKC